MAGVVDQLIEKLDALAATNFEGSDSSRKQLVIAAQKLFYKLETKEEKAMRMAVQEPVIFSVLEALINVGLWDSWTAAGGGEKDIEELVKINGDKIEPELLRHQMRLMAASHIVKETGSDRYAPTVFSLSMGDRSTLIAQGLRVRTDHIAPSSENWPKFLANTNYRMPMDDKKSCYMDAFPEGGGNFFERCNSNPIYQESFYSFMELWTKQKKPWPQFYDTKALFEGANLSDGSAFVVDIGGQHGIDLLRVLSQHPDLPTGSLVLEDLPEVLAIADVKTDKIKLLEHDLFKENAVQPITGARAYFMHCVLHDWSDETSVKILKQTAAVMKPGYSKVLINEIVIPSVGASCLQTAMDCLVMQASANERTEARWRKLIEDAGLKVVKIHPDGQGYESVIEVELP